MPSDSKPPNQLRLEDMTEPELRDLLNSCGRALRAILGSRSQFVLVVFDDPKTGQYLSTCTRASMIEAMRETANRLERNETIDR